MNRHDRAVLLAGLRGQAYSHVWAIREEYEPLLRAVGAGESQVSDDLVAALEARVRTAQEDPEPVGGVATIPVKGTISSTPSLLSMLFGLDSEPITQRVTRQLRSAANNPDVKAVVLDIDSPGGTVDGVPELATEIRAARKSKPITAVANSMAGSAAYWLASQASDVSVTKSGDIGSIGVFKLHDDISAADAQAGFKTTLIKAGKYKAEMLPYFPLSAEAHDYQQGQVNHFHDMFTGDVARGRRVTPSVVKADFGQGRMLLAKHAVAAGLADRVESLEAATSRLKSASPGSLSTAAAELGAEDAAWMAAHADLFDENKPEVVSTSRLAREDRIALLALLA